MELRPLGRTGVHVSKFCLGAGMFGKFGNTDHDECIRMVHTALDAGINMIDTSDVYSFGEAEEIVGKALKGRRDRVVLATKFGLPMGSDPNRAGGSRRWIVHEVENSLRRLQTDYIDLYQMHRPDERADLDDTLGALSDLVHQGKIRLFGSSTFPVEKIVEAHWTSERRGYERFRTEQVPYSILARRVENGVLPTCLRYGMGVLVWSPLAQGWLSGKYRKGKTANDVHRGNLQPQLFDMSNPENQRKIEVIEALASIADQAGLELIHIAMAFVCQHPAISSAILGPRTPDHLNGLLPAADIHLEDGLLDLIDQVVRPGFNISVEDDGYTPPELLDATLRRRPAITSGETDRGATERLREMFDDNT